MTISGIKVCASRSANSLSTSTRLAASQANILALVSFAKACRSSVERAANATLTPSLANSRASEADKPAPAPTINALVIYLFHRERCHRRDHADEKQRQRGQKHHDRAPAQAINRFRRRSRLQ